VAAVIKLAPDNPGIATTWIRIERIIGTDKCRG
jgi:hypothetical protein